jgi:DMSO/TMAO reductase YedYZ molybdopterin-dependent catalytic subunit
MTTSRRHIDEHDYDGERARQWLDGTAAGRGLSRRDVLRTAAVGSAAIGLAAFSGHWATAAPAAPAPPVGPIRKPLPPDLFTVFGTNAETKWEALRGVGYHTPVDRFYVRNHTSTPTVDRDTWRLRLFGTGLRGAPTRETPIELSFADLRRLPSETYSAVLECAGNGRSFFTTQQGRSVTGTAWRLGAVGVARWRGVRLSTVLRRAGLTRTAVDVLPAGLDPNFVSGGVDLGPVRRPLPVAKALDDVLLAYEMNGQPLLPDHGFPVRLVVPNWIGIASVKWVGEIEVSDQPLFSPWNTQFYRYFGAGFPPEGSPPLTRQVTKSAFELPFPATVPAARTTVLTGRSWSGNGPVERVRISTDGGTSWRRPRIRAAGDRRGWTRWELPWRPHTPGEYELLARATDSTGHSQPDQTPLNDLGYLFDAVVRHPVTVT